MPAFKFRFQALLKQRQAAEDTAKRQLAERLSSKSAMENKLRSMQDTIRESKADLGGALVGQINMQRVGHIASHASRSVFDGHDLVRQLAIADRAVQAARELVAEARKQTKALELLKDKEFTVWKKAMNAKQAIEMDDVASSRYTRQLQAAGGVSISGARGGASGGGGGA